MNLITFTNIAVKTPAVFIMVNKELTIGGKYHGGNFFGTKGSLSGGIPSMSGGSFAFGDNTRQCIIITLIKNGGKGGLRVGEIQKETSVSRTAVSHHLKVLLETGIINVRRKGTPELLLIWILSSSLPPADTFLGAGGANDGFVKKNRKDR